MKKYILFFMLMITGILGHQDGWAQMRSGFGYLKINPGAREIGQGNTVTGLLDYTYAFYDNPGATGLMREWQWSATYTKWLPDVYHATLLSAYRIRTPWSQHTRAALAIDFLGVGDFDNTGGLLPHVSGSDMLVSLSMGQPITFLSRNISVGVTSNYYRTSMAGYSADRLVFDFGTLLRSPRFRLLPIKGLFEHGIISAGAALTNVGRDMTLVREATPLPQTFQTGLGLYVGSHNSFQINFSADYRKIRDEDGFITFGTEFSWRQFASIRFGFNYENRRLVEAFTIGGSLRLDDVILGSSMVGQNRALRMDLALNEGNPFFDSPYHGTATYFPLQPEHFRRYFPANGTVIDTSVVYFSWEKTRDPDLYDDVRTWLLVDTDSTRLDTLMRNISTRVDVNSAETEHAILLHQEATSQNLTLDHFAGNVYYWTVLAQDLDFHARYGTENKQKISKFTVTRPKLKIDRIEFEYSPWITQDPYQGEIKIHISNYGNRIGRGFYLDVVDSTLNLDSSSVIWPRFDIPDLAPGKTTVFQTSWNTSLAGLHEFIGRICWSNSALMFEARDQFYTIPKGYLSSADSVMALELKRIQYNLPIVGKVFFDSSSSDLQTEFFKWETEVEPLLITLAKRMIRYEDVTIDIQGAYDPNSDSTPTSLARERAKTVRDKLVELGVHPSRMHILADNVLPRSYTPSDPLDALRYFEDRRVVNIVTAEANEEKLFEPMISFFDSQRTFPVPFSMNIRTVVPTAAGELLLNADTLATSVGVPGIESLQYIEKTVDWHLPNLAKTKNSIWLNKSLQYHIELDDSLNRHFRSHPLEIAVHERLMPMERLVWLIAIFAEAKPYYNFYWANLLDNIPFLTQTENARFRFIGHGCAIGPIIVNKILSEQRGTLFSELFLNDVKRLYPGLYQDIKTHMDPPQGHGENEPLEFLSTEGQSVLLGDNNLPSGRQKNRRVLVHFYRKMK